MVVNSVAGLEILSSRKVPHIQEQILFSLDYKSFRDAVEVWPNILAVGRNRRKARDLWGQEFLNERDTMDEEELVAHSQIGNDREADRLLTGMVDPDCVGRQGTTPLVEAAKFGHEVVANILIESGADPNKANEHGSTPIYWAARRGHRGTVELLLQRGADPNILGHDGDTPLYWAAKMGDRDMVRLLLDGRANPNKQDFLIADGGEDEDLPGIEHVGDPPLLVATERNDLEMVKMLLRAWAEPNLSGCCGDTPLSRAVKQGNAHIAQTLLDAGANPDHAHKEEGVVRDIKHFLLREKLIRPE